jgi:L-ascorbate metabolism protein UlaG (beta-lactamase superfamily)
MPTLKYFGQSAFRISDRQHTVFIDPFMSGNPVCESKPEEVEKCDFILLTHAHADHYGDTELIAKSHSATIICTHELATWFQSRGLRAHPMAVGGGRDFSFGRVELTPALHGCGSDPTLDGKIPPPNTPVGFLVQWGKSTVLYHAGDTGLFSDMKLIGQKRKIDVACLPIGDNFTMGIEDAAKAAGFLDAATCVPMHYNTFEVIKADPLAFAYRIEKEGRKCKVMAQGTKVEF